MKNIEPGSVQKANSYQFAVRIGMGIDSRDRKRRVEGMNSTQKQFSLNADRPESKFLSIWYIFLTIL